VGTGLGPERLVRLILAAGRAAGLGSGRPVGLGPTAGEGATGESVAVLVSPEVEEGAECAPSGWSEPSESEDPPSESCSSEDPPPSESEDPPPSCSCASESEDPPPESCSWEACSALAAAIPLAAAELEERAAEEGEETVERVAPSEEFSSESDEAPEWLDECCE